MLVIGAIGGTVAMRLVKKGADCGGSQQTVTLEFTPADLARVEAKPIARWLPVSGDRAAGPPGDGQGQSVRRRAPDHACAKAKRCRRGSCSRASTRPTSKSKLIERMGALESAKAQLALAEKNRTTNSALLKQNFISQNAFDTFESSFNVAQGNMKSAEAQVQIARNALKDAIATSPLTGIVAKRHVQPGEKVAFDSPLVTIVDLKDLELQAMVPAVDVPELAIGKTVELTIDGFGERKFTGRIERMNPSTEPGTRAILVYVGIPNRRRRAARRDVRDRPHRARGERPRRDVAGDCGAHRGRADVRVDRRERQARASASWSPAAATRPPGASS